MSNNIQNILDEEFKLLIRATRNELFHFISVQYNHYDLVRKVKKDLAAQYPNRPVHSFNLDNCNPETFIHDILASKSGLIFIEKFDLIFTESFRSLCIGFNQRRDLFSTFPIQIIVFIPSGEENLQNFQKAMPDVFSIVNPMIQLVMEIEANELNFNRFENNEYSFTNIDEARKEIIRIEKRIKELQSVPGIDKIIISLKIKLASSYEYCGEYLKSKILLEELLNTLEKRNQKDYELEISSIQNSLALRLHDLGDFKSARKLFEKEISYWEKKNGYNKSYLSRAYSNLAALLKDLGKYNEAIILFEKALILEKSLWGDEHPNVAVQYSNLGLVLEGMGKFNDAKKLLEKSVMIEEINLGENHPSTALTYSNLALVLNSLGDYEGAKKLLKKAMKTNKEIYGTEHPSTSLSYSNLGNVYKELGDYESARELLEKAVAIDEKVFGKENPITGQSYFNLGLVYFELNQYPIAIFFLEKGYNIYVNNFGNQHPNTKFILQNLSNIRSQILNIIESKNITHKQNKITIFTND